jgi:hypothetical protein
MTPDSLMHGIYEEYLLDGTVHRRMEYIGGRLNGSYEKFYPSGVIASRHRYENDYAHGPYSWYHENGQLSQQGEKVWGKTEGKVTLYYPNGQVEAKRNYVDEKPRGAAYEYYLDGNIRHFFYYDSDREKVFSINYANEGKVDQVIGRPFADLESSFNRFSGKFELDFDLVLPPNMLPTVELLRRQEKKAWQCPIRSDSLHYKFREPLPDDFDGKYQLKVTYSGFLDTLRFMEEVFVRNNEVYFGEPVLN